MSDTTTTFLNFIKEHSIQIPLIQRDYVQGLALNDKTKEKRDEFVKKLLDAILPNGKPYTLDFIYGARESYEEGVVTSNAHFLPLDGQQRLTTLYLIHWVLAVKTNKDGSYNHILDLLKKFSYKTRITSDKFCRRLLASKFFTDKTLYEQIKDKTWYVSLEIDPTVIAIMEMIKQIESTLATEPYNTNLDKMARLLFDERERRITFSILDMERYHLTDGLYVKMNARGKELTPFENWKADFINLISEKEEQKDKFTYYIEHDWNDLFWKDVYKEYADKVSQTDDEKEKKRIKYPRIDEHFMNFFTNFSRLYFFTITMSEEPKVEEFNGKVWSTTETLFGKNTGLLERLFDDLNTLVKIDLNGGIETFFYNLFYTNQSTGWDEHTTKVKLFGGQNINLFSSCFEDDNFTWQHVMLYAILKYCTKHKVFIVTEDMKIYARICRNYLYQHNYLDNGKVTIVPQIRVVDMKIYDKVFDFLSSEQKTINSLKKTFHGEDAKYLDIERKKIVYYDCENLNVLKLVQKIEDLSYCHGYIQAFDGVLNKCIDGTFSCDKVWEAIYSFRNATNLQKAQLFIAFNYKGMTIGNDCAYGKRIFIGGKDKWDVHFRKSENGLDQWISKYVETYLHTPNVANLIADEQSKIGSNPSSMRDYMLKYENVLAAQVWERNSKDDAPFYYAMPNPWNDFDAIVIHSFSNRPLGNAYQTCPMANAVARSMYNYDRAHMGYSGQGSRKEGIMIHNGDWSKVYFSLRFAQTEWHISTKSFDKLSSLLKKHFMVITNDEGKTSHYVLLISEGKDLIQGAIDFMQEVVKEFKENNLI